MPRKSTRIPKYCLHKGTGQAYVNHDGHRHYLGVHCSDESIERYNRFIGELVSSPADSPRQRVPSPYAVTVSEVLAGFWAYAKGYYVKDGRPTSQVGLVKASLGPVRELYQNSAAEDFGPIALKAVRQRMIESHRQPTKNNRPRKPLCRKEVNRRVQIVKQAFKWAVAEEMIRPAVYQALQAVPGLKKGRTKVADHPPVAAVSDEVIDATVPVLPVVVGDMVKLQRLTGMRPGEVTSIRPCDVDRSDKVWVYTPGSHKTAHQGRSRQIFIGPKAQAILTPYLLRAADAVCFSPVDSEKRRRAAQHATRKTRLSCGNRPGTNRTRTPKRKPKDHYDKNAYAIAVRRAIQKANTERKKAGLDPLPRWTPNMLRHSAATEIRKQFDLEAVQSILGHASMNTSEIYAEKNMALAREIARKIG